MSVALVTGSAGVVGSEKVRFFAQKGLDIIGIDNDMRRYFFGVDASTEWNKNKLLVEIQNYEHSNIDIRNKDLTVEFRTDHLLSVTSHDTFTWSECIWIVY